MPQLTSAFPGATSYHSRRTHATTLSPLCASRVTASHYYNIKCRRRSSLPRDEDANLRVPLTCLCVCRAYSVGVCVCVGRVERPRRRLCLAGAFTTRRGLGGSPCTSPCDHREETGLIPGGRRYIRIEWSPRAQSSCTFVPPPSPPLGI